MSNPEDPRRGGVVVYQSPDSDVRVDVRFDQGTVWLSLDQMAALFGRHRTVVSKHIRNVFSSKELERISVSAIFATTASDGRTYAVDFYNLDAIISVGYRVNSLRGTQFRIWATRTLRQHLLHGYSLHERRLRERGLGEVQQAIDLLARTLAMNQLVTDEGRAVLDVVQRYARTWHWLFEYDEDRLPFYRSAQERAALLLYFTVKDHPFADGNKRIGALLFLECLRRHGLLLTSDGQPCLADTATAALTLLIAESRPAQKDLLVRLVLRLPGGAVDGDATGRAGTGLRARHRVRRTVGELPRRLRLRAPGQARRLWSAGRSRRRMHPVASAATGSAHPTETISAAPRDSEPGPCRSRPRRPQAGSSACSWPASASSAPTKPKASA